MADEQVKKIYTRRGDSGETGLLLGGRVAKTDPRVAACGVIDEANSALGLARSLTTNLRMKELTLELQRQLFIVGAEIATPAEHRGRLEEMFETVTAKMTARLEATMDELGKEVELPPAFIIPGASAASGAMDVARAVLRRAERESVALDQAGLLENAEVLRYLNRLADLLFVLARYEDRHLPPEVLTGVRKPRRSGRVSP